MTSGLTPAISKVIDYVVRGKYEGIIVSGRSGDLTLELFTAQWRIKKPQKAAPPIINIGSSGNNCLYLGSEMASSMDQLLEEIDPGFDKTRKYLHLDDHADSGNKLRSLLENFPQLGFTDVDLAVYIANPTLEAFFRENDRLYAGEFTTSHLGFFASLKEALLLDHIRG